MTFSPPMQTGAAVPLRTLLQFVGHQTWREILTLVPSHMVRASCKHTEKELRQDPPQGSDPLCHTGSQQVPMALRKSKFILGSSKSPFTWKKKSWLQSKSRWTEMSQSVLGTVETHLELPGFGFQGLSARGRAVNVTGMCMGEKRLAAPTLGQTSETWISFSAAPPEEPAKPRMLCLPLAAGSRILLRELLCWAGHHQPSSWARAHLTQKHKS